MKATKPLFVILLIVIGVLFSCKKDDQFKSLQVFTNDITEITVNSVNLEGRIDVQGKADITEAGFCWSDKSNSTIRDSKLNVENTSGELNYEELVYNATIDSLLPNQVYYCRAYAIYNGYIVYGNEKIFKTAEDLTPFWSFGLNDKVLNMSIIYVDSMNALIFNNSDKTADMGLIQFSGGLQAPKTYDVVATTLELGENQAQVSNLIIDAHFWNSAGVNAEKIYTEEKDGEIIVKFNNLTLVSSSDPKLNNTFSGLLKVKL